MESVEVTGIGELQEKLKAISPQSPEMRKKIHAVLRIILKDVRKGLSQEARTGLKMKGDPRDAYKAVRFAVYKKILGGQVNILQKRKAGALHLPEYTRREARTGRGGNRWGRSERTNQVDGYWGADRGFVLRFLNQGTQGREVHSYTGRDGARHTLSKNANRAQIESRDWFGEASVRQYNRFSADLDAMIDKAINEVF